MAQQQLISHFTMFGMAGLLGFLIGLERAQGVIDNPHAGTRDFVIFALVGATCAFLALQYDNAWIIIAGFAGVLTLLVAGYWAQYRRDAAHRSGVTTEAAVIITYFLGVLVVNGNTVLAIAIAIAVLVVLSEKHMIERFSKQIQTFELQATLKLLVITFIVLPILPHKSLDNYVTTEIGKVTAIAADGGAVEFEALPEHVFEKEEPLYLYLANEGAIGGFEIRSIEGSAVVLTPLHSDQSLKSLAPGAELLTPLVPRPLSVMLSALKPFKLWLIVVLVSFIGFIGYVLIKVVGAGAGVALTGLIGGLASSTVTTLSFAARSKELPALSRVCAVAVILASAIMFPRVVLQIAVFNQPLMTSIALPMLVSGGTGLLMAILLYWRSKGGATVAEEISFKNPFSLKSAISFGLVFAAILVTTRIATAYLGDAWLPLVAIVSGLTDADAIAFSVSDLQRAGMISQDWAAFNLVLGSLANTYMKLFLVFSLGHRQLFKQCLLPFLLMGAAGIVSMLLYYDIW